MKVIKQITKTITETINFTRKLFFDLELKRSILIAVRVPESTVKSDTYADKKSFEIKIPSTPKWRKNIFPPSVTSKTIEMILRLKKYLSDFALCFNP